MTDAVKVFCSYRGVDRPAVEGFATLLRNDGIDVWLDVWEIEAGDDIVEGMDRGIDGCDAGPLFISPEWFDGAWAQDEQTSLRWRRVEHGVRVIPVTIGDVPVERLPANIGKLRRIPIEHYDEALDALRGVGNKPDLGAGTTGVVTHVELSVVEVDSVLTRRGGRRPARHICAGGPAPEARPHRATGRQGGGRTSGSGPVLGGGTSDDHPRRHHRWRSLPRRPTCRHPARRPLSSSMSGRSLIRTWLHSTSNTRPAVRPATLVRGDWIPL